MSKTLGEGAYRFNINIQMIISLAHYKRMQHNVRTQQF